MHTFNPALVGQIAESEAAWSMEQVPGQPGHSQGTEKPCLNKTKQLNQTNEQQRGRTYGCVVCNLISVAVEGLRQEDLEFETNFSYIGNSWGLGRVITNNSLNLGLLQRSAGQG